MVKRIVILVYGKDPNKKPKVYKNIKMIEGDKPAFEYSEYSRVAKDGNFVFFMKQTFRKCLYTQDTLSIKTEFLVNYYKTKPRTKGY